MQSKYDDYMKYLNNSKDKIFQNAIRIYYNNNPKQKCPKCGKIGIDKKITENGIIYMKDNKCSWNMEIEPPEYINLYQVFNEKDYAKKKVLYDLIITDNKEEFNKFKNIFIDLKTEVDQIKDVFNFQKLELEKLDETKYNLLTNLLILYYKRKEVFAKITNNIKDTKSLIEIFKNEGSYNKLSDNRLKQISKEYNISIDDIKYYLKWLNLCKDYIKLQTELNEYLKKNKNMNANISNINNNFLIKLPKITENKQILTEPIKYVLEKIQDKDVKEDLDNNEIDANLDDKEVKEDLDDKEIKEDLNDKEIKEDLDENETNETNENLYKKETKDDLNEKEIKGDLDKDEKGIVLETSNEEINTNKPDPNIKVIKIKKEHMIPDDENDKIEDDISSIPITIQKREELKDIPSSGQKKYKLKIKK